MQDLDLENVRTRIQQIDRDLISLAAERVELARRVGEIKRQSGQPIVDYGQELRVMARAHDEAVQKGLDPTIAENLLTRLIRAAITVQEADNVRSAAGGVGKRVVLVGGAGRMGRWMNSFLAAQGYDVGVIDPRGSAEEAQRVGQDLADADLVISAAPPSATASLYRSWCAAPPRGVICDLASIKTPLIEPIRALQRAGGRVASLHPMFGPSTVVLRGNDVVVCDTDDEEATLAAEELFRPTTARLIRIPLLHHDRFMADLLSLAHATAIVFALALPDTGPPLQSPTFRTLEALATAVVRESPDVYFEIQADNPHSLSAVERLRAAVEELLSVVRARDRRDFHRLMEEGQRRTAMATAGLEGSTWK